MARIIAFISLLWLVFAPAAQADFRTHQYGMCFHDAAMTYRVSPDVLFAIARVESNFNPAAINWNSNGSFDYGIMQINSSWYPTLGQDLWFSLGDPCTNIKVGAWILADCTRRYGNTWEAIGCYNAKSAGKRTIYAWKVYHALTQPHTSTTAASGGKPAKKRKASIHAYAQTREIGEIGYAEIKHP